MTTTGEFLSSYERIKEANKTALNEVERAVELERQENHVEAMKSFQQSLKYIDELFSIPVALPDNSEGVDTEWKDACVIIQKLKIIKVNVTHKLEALKAQFPNVDLQENSNSNTSSPVRTFKEIVKDLQEVMADKNIPVFCDTLFEAQVKLYKILPNGEVQTTENETGMSLIMCNVGEKWSHLNGVCFIQCSLTGATQNETDQATTSKANNVVWMYPLVSTVTTCFRTDYGAFIFPDFETGTTGSAFGIMLAKPAALTQEQFDDMQQFFLDLLEAILANRIQELSPPPQDTSQKVSKHIVTAADFIARNMVKGAEISSELMMKTTPYIMSKMTPAPENPTPVAQGVQTTVEVAKCVTNAAVDLTGWVAGKVGSASMAIGRYLAPHVQHHGTNLLQKTCGMDEQEASGKMDGAFNVVTGAVEGFSTIFHGLEKSAVILGTNLKENSVKIMEYKYGSSAGFVTADTFDAFGNVFVVSHNVHYILPTGIAQKTSCALVDEVNRNRNGESQNIMAGALYADLKMYS